VISKVDRGLFLLDTDTLSNMISRRPSEALRRRVDGMRPAELRTSSVTLGELLQGAFLRVERQGLLRRINALVAEFRILPFDAEAARTFGPVAALLQRSGRRIGDADTRIASIALTHDLTVVTGNVRHFSRVPGLRVENWL